MCAYSVFNTFPVYPLSAKPLILLAFCRYRYHTSLLGVPIFACLQVLVRWLLNTRLKKKNMPLAASEYLHRDQQAPSPQPEEKTDNDK